MSSLKVTQIEKKLLEIFEEHIDKEDLSQTDPEFKYKVLTRCLAAFALYLQTGCTEKEAAAAVWDGSDDNGVDGVIFDTAESRVVIVQSKFIKKGGGEPDAADVATFIKGVKDLIEQNVDSFHPRLHTRIHEISARLNKPGTSVRIVLVSTGASKLSKHALRHITSLLTELNGEDPDPIADHEIMGLSEVYGGLVNDPYQGNLELEATILEWSYVASPYGAYFGMIDGLQLKTWWKTYGKGLLAANIRHSLGPTEVNNQIRDTANTSPENFWYFNNGITLIADEKVKAPAGASSKSSGNFRFKNASLVNGAQTVSALAKVEDDEKLALVRVPFRVILLTDTPKGFGQKVTKTNNLQNRIEPRDFVAQDQEQTRLRMEMAIEDVEYQFVRSEEMLTSDAKYSCELIEVTTALACASGDANLAVQVKTGFSRIFADLSKAPYKTLFNPSISGAKAFNVCIVLRQIDAWIDKKKKILTKKSGAEFGVLVHGNRILAAAVFRAVAMKDLEQSISAFDKVLHKLEIDKKCELVYVKMLKAIEDHYANKFLAVLFKNPTNSKHVYDMSVL